MTSAARNDDRNDEHDDDHDETNDDRAPTTSTDPVRLDKWLWAARIFKTRAVATEAVQGGKVHLNGGRTKPAHHIHPGDILDIQRGTTQMTIKVVGLSSRRGPASTATLLYKETEASRTRREQRAADQAAQAPTIPHPAGRPTKKDRRSFTKLKRF